MREAQPLSPRRQVERAAPSGPALQFFLRNVGEVVLVAGEVVVRSFRTRPGFKEEEPRREVLEAFRTGAGRVRHSGLTGVEVLGDAVAPHGGDGAARDLDSVLSDEIGRPEA